MRLVTILLAAALLIACAPVAQPPAPAPTAAPDSPAEPTAATLPPTAEAAAPSPTVEPTPAPPTATPAAVAPALEATLGHGHARAAAFVPGAASAGPAAVAVATEAGVLLLGFPDLDVRRFTPLPGGAHQIAVSEDGSGLIAASAFTGGNATTTIITVEGQAAGGLPGAQASFSPAGGAVATAELDQATGRYITHVLTFARSELVSFPAGEAPRFSPDGRLLLTNDREQTVVSTPDGRELLREEAYHAAFAPGSSALALSGPQGIELIPVRDGALDAAGRRVLSPQGARAMAFDAEGRLLAFTEMGLVRWGLAAESEPELLRPGMDAAIPEFGPGAVMVALTQPISDAPSPLSLARVEDGQLAYEEVALEGGQPAFSADGRLAAVVTAAGDLRLVDVDAGRRAERRLPGYTIAAFGPGDGIAAARPGPQVDLYPNLTAEQPARSLGEYQFWQLVRELRVEGDATLSAEVELTSFGYTMGFALARWAPDAATPDGAPAQSESLTGESLAITQPAAWDYAEAARLLAYADEGGQVRIVGAAGEPQELPAIAGVPAGALPAKLAFSPDGARLAIGYADGWLAVVDVASLGPVAAGPLGKGQAITALSWGAESRRLAFGLAGGRALVWEPGDDELPAIVPGLADADPQALALNPDGERLAVAGATGAIIFNMADGAELVRVAGPVSAVSFDADGARVALVHQGRVEIWSLGR